MAANSALEVVAEGMPRECDDPPKTAAATAGSTAVGSDSAGGSSVTAKIASQSGTECADPAPSSNAPNAGLTAPSSAFRRDTRGSTQDVITSLVNAPVERATVVKAVS